MRYYSLGGGRVVARGRLRRPAGRAQAHFDGSTWWSHVKVSPTTPGRPRDGSEGLRKAEAYVVEQLTRAGLAPAGSNGFYQPVSFVSRGDRGSGVLGRAGAGRQGGSSLARRGRLFSTRADLATEQVDAPLVFVGYGLRVPEQGHDDFAGLDLARQGGRPRVRFPGGDTDATLAAHYQTMGERWKALSSAGAIGIVNIPNPSSMDVPWARMSLNRAHASMELADPEFLETAGLKTRALVFNPGVAEKLFTGSGHTFAELAALAKDRKPLLRASSRRPPAPARPSAGRPSNPRT